MICREGNFLVVRVQEIRFGHRNCWLRLLIRLILFEDRSSNIDHNGTSS
jgi:hypothetical protein